MTRQQNKSFIRIALYVFSAIVVLSTILSMVGPALFSEPPRPTATWTPVSIVELTAMPTSTATETSTWTRTATPTSAPTPTVQTPTWTPKAVSQKPTATLAAGTATPTVPSSSRLVFAVCGDNRTGDSRTDDDVYERLLERVVQDGNAFLISTGDLVDEGTRKDWEKFQRQMKALPLPFYPVPGNHERDRDPSLKLYLEFSGAPALRYSFDVSNIHFTMVDSSKGALDKEELAWIDQDLAATDQPVKMVVLHHPPFYTPITKDHLLRTGKAELASLMHRHEAAYVFAGHIHAYHEFELDGTIMVVTGGAGAHLHTWHPDAFYHYVQVTVDGTKISTQVIRIE